MVVILTILFNIGVVYTLYRYVKKQMPDYIEDENKAKQIKIYGLVMLLIVLGVTLFRSITYTNINMINELKLMTLLSIIWPLAFIDQKTFKIPNDFIILGLIYRIVILFIELGTSNFSLFILVNELIASVAMFVATMLCRLVVKDSIGYGDIKLFMLMGIFLGVQNLWTSMFLVLLSIFAVCVYLLITKKVDKKSVVPFGPSIVVGTFLAIILFL